VTNFNYERDRAWADSFTPKIRTLVKEYLLKDIIDIRIATDDEDMKYATDYQIKVDGTSIGCRIRRESSCLSKFKDITFRKSRPRGETEIEKMKRTREPRWYLYGWIYVDAIHFWVLMDMNKFRELNLFDSPDNHDIRNPDGSSTFDGWYINRLDRLGCIQSKSESVFDFLNKCKQPEIQITHQLIERKETALSAWGLTKSPFRHGKGERGSVLVDFRITIATITTPFINLAFVRYYQMQASTDFTPTTELLGGSPKMMYTYFLLNQCAKYLDAMKNPDKIDLESTTASLLAFCPDITRREKLFKDYKERVKDTKNFSKETASILTIGDFQAYLSEVLEFTEKSTGGF
jgi:hypothetical protein